MKFDWRGKEIKMPGFLLEQMDVLRAMEGGVGIGMRLMKQLVVGEEDIMTAIGRLKKENNQGQTS